MGCVGGPILEPFDLLAEPVFAGLDKSESKGQGGKWEGYIVFVGWESVEKHEDYHHTEHFRKNRIVLGYGNVGFAEYGHLVFEGGREGKVGGAKL